jgi:AGZA family xanthine/uracil permease-like MFS transporter
MDRFFRISERGSTVATEIKSGVVSFLTMSYILLVNPQILGAAGAAACAAHEVVCIVCSRVLAAGGCGSNEPGQACCGHMRTQ